MAGESSVFLALLLLAGSASAQELAWTTEPYYFADSVLPTPGSSTCCGSDLVGDPSIGDTGNTCLCDLTVGVCDAGCCCDTSCSFEEVQLGGIFGCTANSNASQILGYTLCSDQLVSENIPQSMKDQGLVTSLGGAEGPLCIVSDNTASRGAFFRDPVTSPTSFNPEKVSQELTRFAPYRYDSWLEVVESPFSVTIYLMGAPLMRPLPGAANAITPALFPAASADGGCDGKQYLPFLQDVAPFTCALTPPGVVADAARLADLCGTTLSGAFLQTETFKAAPTTAAANIIPSVGAASGTLYWRRDDGPFVAGSAVPTSGYDAATQSCVDALVSYQLRIITAHDGTVASVSVYATITNMTVPELPTATASYAAIFEYSNEAAGTRPTSGRPGYQRGLPLLVADGASSPQLRTEGLKLLPRTATGACSANGVPSQVLFGENMVSACTITYPTAASLKTACGGDSGVSPAVLPKALVAALNISSTIIGAYGDSHPSVSADWVTLVTRKDGVQWPWDESALVPSWSNDKQECSNYVSGMHLRVLTADVGSISNPVTKVVGAELEVNMRKVRASQCVLMPSSCPTSVSVSASVSFVSIDSESFDFQPESPRIIPPLSYDFFYPFGMQ